MFQVPKEEGLRRTGELIEAFRRGLTGFKSPAYKEAQLRVEFIDPFFEALGWDIYNKSHTSEQYKDVIHEDSIKVAGGTKAPDYCFRIGSEKIFFVEAKKPALNIRDNPRLPYQLRRYGWSANLKLSILTDFEELAVYDCRVRPRESDKVSTARVQYVGFEQYPEQFDDVHGLFGKEAVLQGSFDRYAESKRIRGTAPVDKEFLKEIERWRDLLARNIALRNPRLSVHELNFAVQRTIDRIIFLRICEDRGIEGYGRLEALGSGTNAYGRLLELFDRAEERYNSGLFHFEKERGAATEPDRLTPDLEIDDAALKTVFKGLYYPDSPYEFSMIGADILGHVYEQFLGKVIRLTPAHHAKVEEKPEVRKAGGVYYTPTYIVDYIVKNTVGKLCQGDGNRRDGLNLSASGGGRPIQDDTPTADKENRRGGHLGRPLEEGSTSAGREKDKKPLTTRQVHKLKILDPACGSGSFLIGAYQYLLDYCRDWYAANDPEKHKDKVFRGRGGEWFLTTAEKKRLLLDCIHGVDIDPQAVEVTKLNLLLKALEGESKETLEQQLKLFRERALPDLGGNIKCGNSLIGTDFFDHHQGVLFDDEQLRRINPFDWGAEFPEITQGGGFDAVIGNPPYGGVFYSIELEYLKDKFKDKSSSYDSYELFLINASNIIRKNGRLSMIIPASWLSGDKYSRSRKELTTTLNPVIAYAMPFDVFVSAYIDTAIVIFENSTDYSDCLIHYFSKKQKLSVIPSDVGANVPISNIKSDKTNRFSIVLSRRYASILSKLRSVAITFGELFKIQRGVQPYSRKKHSEQQIKQKYLHVNAKLSEDHLPELQGKELSRYWVAPERTSFIRYCDEIASSRDLSMFQGERIVIRRLITRKFRLQASFVSDTLITTDNVLNMVPKEPEGIDVIFCLGILNSKLISWYYVNTSMIAQKDDFPQVHISALASLPIPVCNDDLRVIIAKLVKKMSDLNKRLKASKDPNERKMLQRQIEATDCQIDQLVYELYGLTDEEIAIVEADLKK